MHTNSGAILVLVCSSGNQLFDSYLNERPVLFQIIGSTQKIQLILHLHITSVPAGLMVCAIAY